MVNSEWGQVSINIRQQDHSETGSMYYIIRCIVQGKQARVKNADLRHPSCTVVMWKRKSVSPVLSVLRYVCIVTCDWQWLAVIGSGTVCSACSSYLNPQWIFCDVAGRKAVNNILSLAVGFRPGLLHSLQKAELCQNLSRLRLTFWRRNYFFNFSTLCIWNVNNTGTKQVRIMKQTAF